MLYKSKLHRVCLLLISYRLTFYKSDSIFMLKTTFGGFMVLVIYVDDILLISIDEACIFATKANLHMHFVTHDLQILYYFTRIKFAY